MTNVLILYMKKLINKTRHGNLIMWAKSGKHDNYFTNLNFTVFSF